LIIQVYQIKISSEINNHHHDGDPSEDTVSILDLDEDIDGDNLKKIIVSR
jgi:hypothetical protein